VTLDQLPPIVPLPNVLEVWDALAKITDVHIDRLRPFQASRTSLPLSHRLRKQNRPGLRRLCSEHYPYLSPRELLTLRQGHPSGPPGPVGPQVARRGPAAQVVHVRRRGRLVLGYRPPPVGPLGSDRSGRSGRTGWSLLADGPLGADRSLLSLNALGAGGTNRSGRASLTSRP
jgi:hypothetical protein